jgi:phage tail-like protein
MALNAIATAFDAAVGWSWSIKIDGMLFSEITQVDGIKLEADVVEYKANTILPIPGLYVHRKLPGRMKSGTIDITRAAFGVDKGQDFTNWLTKIWDGSFLSGGSKDVVIMINDFGAIPVMKFCAHAALPTTIAYGSLKAGDTNVLTEKVTLHHNGMYVGSNASAFKW